MPPHPERGGVPRRALALLAAKSDAVRRGRAVSFRPLVRGETRSLKALVLLVDFADNAATLPASELSDLLLSSRTRPGGSLRDYYDENSNGRLDVTGTVIGWLRAPQTYAYYVDGQAGFGFYPRNAQRLAEDAVAMARSRVDFASFDDDGPDGVPSSGDDDGYVDALLVVHAGEGSEDAAEPLRKIWSHSSTTSREIAGSGASAFFYSMTPEISEVGVQCHEFGHTLGLPDLYDTTPPGDPDSNGLGLWSLMAIGSWAGPPNRLGSRPSHLDAWCKARLGFVDPITATGNLAGAVLHPVEESGEVYRLWTNGEAGPEYFMLENRLALAQNFDRYLPGSGLLVYHVDELADDNDDPNRFRVALVQADGMRDLEEGRNLGDAGDPFPGSDGNHSFGEATDPSSRSNTGRLTQVEITSIEDSDPAALRADFSVENRPSFRLLSSRALASDGWPWPLWGETAPLVVTVANVGLDSGDATAVLLVDDSRVTTIGGAVPLGAPGEDVQAVATFTVVAEAMAADTTLGIPGRLLIAHDGGTDTLAVPLTVGRRFGLTTGFENEEVRAGWTHAPAFAGWRDNWALTNRRVHGGSSSYRFTDLAHETYLINSDGALVSPPVLLGVDSRLEFWHWISAERETGRYAFDGGRVEVSVESGPWAAIEPAGGYPYRLDPFTSTMLEGQRIFSGVSSEWRRVTFDLAGVTGSVRFRFRFVSDQAVNLEGWYVDDISVATHPQRFGVELDSPAEESGGIRLAWRVEEILGAYDGSGFRLHRSTDRSPGADPSHGYESIAEVPADSAGAFTYLDAAVTRGLKYSYLLEDRDASGAMRAVYGPVSVFLTPESGAPALEAPFPNPFRPANGALTLSYVVPGRAGEDSRGPLRLALYDILGRRIRVLDERPAMPGQVTVVWDGKDGARRDMGSSVYILRLEGAGANTSRRLVLIH